MLPFSTGELDGVQAFRSQILSIFMAFCCYLEISSAVQWGKAPADLS